MQSKSRATLIGLIAVLLWNSIVGLIRSVSQHLGAVDDAAMIYTVASRLLVFTVGFNQLKMFPRRCLPWGSLLFVSYELCLSPPIGYTDSGRQVIEAGVVNYLWSVFTMLSAIAFNKQRANALIVPGVLISVLGICFVLDGEQGLDIVGMAENVKDNPLSYELAFTGAVIWAAYCIVTSRIAAGKNGVMPFFILTALALWIKFFATGGGAMDFSVSALTYLALVASAMGFGYAAWNVSILHDSTTVLAGAPYFIPVFSAALAAVLLHAPLSLTFWKGAAMVVAESILCWLAARGGRAKTLPSPKSSTRRNNGHVGKLPPQLFRN